MKITSVLAARDLQEFHLPPFPFLTVNVSLFREFSCACGSRESNHRNDKSWILVERKSEISKSNIAHVSVSSSKKKTVWIVRSSLLRRFFLSLFLKG